MIDRDTASEIDIWLITIDAHCAVIADPEPTKDDIVDLAGCIKDCVADIRRILNKDDPRAAYRHLEVMARTGSILTPSPEALAEIARLEESSADWDALRSTAPYRNS